MKWVVIIEKSKIGFSAYVLDLQGCVQEKRKESMIEDGDPIPQPTSRWEYVEVQLPS